MMNTNLQQTGFYIEKLKNVVNVSGSSAYQIFTCPGPAIGRLGTIPDLEIQSPANEAKFEATMTAKNAVQHPVSWIKQVLSVFRG